MNALAADKPDNPLERLHDEVMQLCNHVLHHAALRLDQHADLFDQHALTKSSVNLAHYLALRELDLRPLQEKLAESGLSSLGRAESHVFATLQAVMSMLSQATGKPLPLQCNLPYPAFREGFEILSRNTSQLFGPSNSQHETRIMVTLPTEAASDPRLVEALLEEGMDCARINCAHDSNDIWSRMIDNVRQAAARQRRECRILMDLAGHKVRTGPVALESAAVRIKVKKNRFGLTQQPAQLRFVSEANGSTNQAAPGEVTTLALPAAILHKLRIGDRLAFHDARGKQRHFHVYASDATGAMLATCNKNTLLHSGARLFVQRKRGMQFQRIDSFEFRDTLQQPARITLNPDDELILHASPEPGEAARYTEDGNLIAPAHISCTLSHAISLLSPGDPVWIDDGKISCTVKHVSNDAATLQVLRTGPKGAKLRADKGINFPQTDLQLPALSEKDKQDLDFVCGHADLVGFSFVESGEDIRLLIHELQQRQRKLPIVAKIETERAVRNLPDILFSGLSQHPLAIMIARGDLAVELGSVRMAEIQEEMLWLCEAAHVPVIWATQVLESIAKHGVRSRPEFTDAAMGIRAECVMLNKGPYILDAVRSLGAVLARMHAHQRKKISRLRALHW
ncbi:MAG: pyruvate kinase [Gammaproteobacteria bacterium]|nr:pyruvate kinase [Gammaproteobacteria bacterium]